MEFTKIDSGWESRYAVDGWEDFPSLAKLYMERYPTAKIEKKYSHSDSMPGWPPVVYYKFIIKFQDTSDEAEFILRESL